MVRFFKHGDYEIKGGSIHVVFENTSVNGDFSYLERKISLAFKNERFTLKQYDTWHEYTDKPGKIIQKYYIQRDDGTWGKIHIKYIPKGRFNQYYINIYQRSGNENLEQKALGNLLEKLKS